MLIPILALFACTRAEEPVPAAWDAAPPGLDCTAGQPADLLDAALADANLDRADIGYSDAELALASYAAVLDDAFLLPWFRELQADPEAIPCFTASRDAALAHYADLGHPATGAVTVAMALLDEPAPDAPIDASTLFDDIGRPSGLRSLMDATEGNDTPLDTADLPDGLMTELEPVFAAMTEVVLAWGPMADAVDDPERSADYGHGGLIIDFDSSPDLAADGVQDRLLGAAGPRALYGPSLQLAFAIENADLGPYTGQGSGILLELRTAMGDVLITGGDAQAFDEDRPVLFHLDLGGDDQWQHSAGGNAAGMPLSVMIDLQGNDRYGYAEVPHTRDGERLPSDLWGRYNGDANYGPFSVSKVGRQGSGRFGVGMLFDLGGGQDTYTSLRTSQGWAHQGVGVLRDDGGDDQYRGEAGMQGAASMGIGVLIDEAGSDLYSTWTYSQGFGYAQAVGILFDRGGDDTYIADTGSPELGGDPIYHSPQMPGQGNSSFSQGAGFGRRGDADGAFLSGGIGILRDEAGHDAYTASVFGQGTGYWQGTGVLSDAGGNDSYDAFYYVHGAAAHYAIGALLDGGGDDMVGQQLTPRHVQLGSGHDFSIGLYIDESGNDTYRYGGLAAGSSNCQGIGLFADNGGDDHYEALSDLSTGLGNHSGECIDTPRIGAQAVGLFMDAGGSDIYVWPEGSEVPAPADGSTFGHRHHDHDTEHGGAVDGTGETGLHVP